MNKENIVIKKIADNFWVKTPESVVCCKPMGKLKKSGVFVGDKVELNYDGKQYYYGTSKKIY